MAISGARAQNWQTLTLQIPAGRMSHGFSLMQGGAVFTSLGTPQWIESVVSGGSLHYGSFQLQVDGDDQTQTPLFLSDDTAGELYPSQIALGYTGAVEFPANNWSGSGGAPRQFFFLSEARAGHVLILCQPASPGGAAVSYPVSIQTWTYQNGGAQGQAFEGSASYDPLKTWWLVDLSETPALRSPDGESDVSRDSLWTIDYSRYPLVPVTLYLEGREAGHRFTVHSRMQGSPEMMVSATAQSGSATGWPADGGGWIYDSGGNYCEVPSGSASITASVATGFDFWVTRDADSVSTQPALGGVFTAALTGPAGNSPDFIWLVYGVFPDPPQRSTEAVTFRINAQRWGHTFSVWQSDGYHSQFGSDSSESSQPYTWDTITNWDDQGLYNPLSILAFSANIDPTRLWWLVDNEDYYGSPLPPLHADVFDGWVPQHEAPPVETSINLQLPASLIGSWFRLSGPDGEIGESSPYDSRGTETETVAGLDEMANFEIHSFSLSFIKPNPYATGPFLLEDVTDGSNPISHPVLGGMNDLRLNFRPPQPLLLNISSSRWDHELLIRHPEGTAYPVSKQQTQGGTSFDPTGLAWQTSYYYFDATATANPDLPWYLEDASTGERIGPNPEISALIDWIAVKPPLNLTATASANGIDLAWVPGEASTGGGFIIERRESMQSGGAFTPWHVLQRVGESPATWHDTRLAPGEYVIYRVRAFFGSGANERHSAPSNRARAAMWRDNGDGTYGSPGGDDGTGGGPVDDPAAPGAGGGDIPGIAGDGDGDGDPDNDKDGVVDTSDRYPDDPLRNDDIPVKFHGVVDLNKYLETPFVVGVGAGGPLITISDANHVAWAGIVKSNVPHPLDSNRKIDVLRIVTWADGAVIGDASIPLVEKGTGIPFPGSPLRNFVREISITPVGISVGSTSDGSDTRVAGNAGATVLWEDTSGSYGGESGYREGTFDCYGNGLSDFSLSLVGPFSQYQRLSREGHLFWLRRWKVQTGGIDEEWQRATIDGEGVLPEERKNNRVSGVAISDNGTTVVEISGEAGSPASVHLCLPDGTEQSLPILLNRGIYGVNDQKWIVGDKRVYEDVDDFPTGSGKKGRGELGFVWTPAKELQAFHDLLPGEYKKQLRSAVPFMITNVDQTTGKPRILFRAEDYEEHAGVWNSRTLILSWNTAGEPVVDRIMLPVANIDGTTHAVQEFTASFAAWNTQDFAALVEIPPKPSSSLRIPNAVTQDVAAPKLPFSAILTGIRFEARDSLSEGFDPPLVGDYSVDRETGVKTYDKEDWSAWTSVMSSDTSDQNELVKIVFDSPKAFEQCELFVPDAEHSGESDLITVYPKTFSTKETDIKIEYNPGKTMYPSVQIQVRDKNTHQTLPGMYLNVMVLPKRGPLKVRIFTVHNAVGSSAAVTDAFLREPPDLPAAAQFEAELNARFRASAVTFVATGSDPIETTCRYDVSPPSGALELGTPVKASPEETLFNTLFAAFPGDIAILFVRNLGGGSSGHYSDQTGYVFVNYDAYFSHASKPDYSTPDAEGTLKYVTRVVAHEVGHKLGLSTRQQIKMLNLWYSGHDVDSDAPQKFGSEGIHPKGTHLLMRPGGLQMEILDQGCGVWVRHEDWKKSNAAAGSTQPHRKVQ